MSTPKLNRATPLRDVLQHFDGNKSRLARSVGKYKQQISRLDMNSQVPEAIYLRLRYEVIPHAYECES